MSVRRLCITDGTSVPQPLSLLNENDLIYRNILNLKQDLRTELRAQEIDMYLPDAHTRNTVVPLSWGAHQPGMTALGIALDLSRIWD